jgi:hypothetical protein
LGVAGLPAAGEYGTSSRSTIAGSGGSAAAGGVVAEGVIRTDSGCAGAAEVADEAAPTSGASGARVGRCQPAIAASTTPIASKAHNIERERATAGVASWDAAAGGATFAAALALRAARRALASGELSDRRNRDNVRETVPAPASASSGWVIVAS